METSPPGPEAAGDTPALLRRLTPALLVVGLLWRTLRYLLRFPIWGDEAMLCLNFQELGYAGLTRQLHHCQVAPLLFLWGELTSLRLLGGSELAMHLLPFLAGVGSLLLFWRLARLTLAPPADTLALGFLAVAIWPVSMATLAKPYAFDLFMPLLLLVPAAHWLYGSQSRAGWLLLLVLLTPVAVFGSFPVVFVGGAISLALLPGVWRRGGRKARLLYLAYNAVLLGSFLGHYLVVGRAQLRTPVNGTTTARGMEAYWADGFPPSSPLALARWLFLIHTGQMTAYPVGASDGGSSLTALLCLVGAWALWRARRRALLVLCAAPFALGLLAAVLRRYPYGASCRLSQHVAPAVCLLAGLGAAALIGRVRSATLRRRWLVGVCTLFVAVGIGGMVRDVRKPYRDEETRWTREVMRRFDAEARSGAPIVVLNRPEEMDALFRWHLGLYGDRVSWAGRVDWAKARAGGEVLCVRFWWHRLGTPEQLVHAPTRGPASVPADFQARLVESKQPWALKEAVSDTGVPPGWRDPVKHLDQFRWVLDTSGHTAMRGKGPKSGGS